MFQSPIFRLRENRSGTERTRAATERGACMLCPVEQRGETVRIRHVKTDCVAHGTAPIVDPSPAAHSQSVPLLYRPAIAGRLARHAIHEVPE